MKKQKPVKTPAKQTPTEKKTAKKQPIKKVVNDF